MYRERIGWGGRGLRAVIGLVWVASVLAWPAVGPAAVEDNFDDNARNTTLWPTIDAGGAAGHEGEVNETNQRLEYASPGTTYSPPDDENWAYYVYQTPLPRNTSWTVTLDVHVGDYSGGTTDHEYGVEIGIFNNEDTDDVIWFGHYRGYDEEGSSAIFDWCICKDTDETEWPDNYADATRADGTLKLAWDSVNAEFEAYYKEDAGFIALTTDLDVDDWGLAGANPFTLVIGGYDEECDFELNDGSVMYADNFNLVPEPATLGLLALGGLAALLLRRRRA